MADAGPEVLVLEALTSGIRTALGDDLVAVYLYGSYVSGGFDAHVSDLDLVVVTEPEIDALDLDEIERMHARIALASPDWDDRIEVVYVGRATLASFRSSAGRLAVVSPGEPFHVRDDRVVEWLQNWYLVRQTGVVLDGPPAADVIPSVSWAEFVAAAARYAAQIARQDLRAASPGTIAYNVLTMCRAHMAVRGSLHGSKQEAAAWARRRSPEWAPVINEALRCRSSRGSVGFEVSTTRADAARFIEFVASAVAALSIEGPRS